MGLKADEETTRLAKNNEITMRKFEDFKEQLHEHWKHCKRENLRKPLETTELTGQQILDDSLKVDGYLDGQIVSQRYLSRGTLHSLANSTEEPKVGWHPQFIEKLEPSVS